MEALANVVAGLGLFFVGVWILSDNLKNLAGRSFRQSVVQWTKKTTTGFALGSVLGAVAQSMAVTIFILVSLLTAGLITVRTAMPVLVGANLGTSILVFLTTLNVKLVMLYIIGISGIIMVSERFSGVKAHVGALFGVGLLFLGITMLQEGAITLVDKPWTSELLESFSNSYFITFLIGCAITFIAQSAAATSVLAIALAGAGVFQFEQTVMAIYGANFGSGLVSLLLSGKLKGKSRQLAMYQILFLNFLGTLLFVIAFYAESLAGVPLVNALVTKISGDLEQQMAWVYLFLNTPGIFFLLFSGVIDRFLQNQFPATQSENDSQPQYIHDQAINDPGSALDLVNLEQRHLVSFYTRYFELLRQRDSAAGNSTQKLHELHDSFLSVSGHVSELLEDLGSVRSTNAIHERLNRAMSNNRTIQMIESTLFDLVITLSSISPNSSLHKIKNMTTEALDTVLLTLNDVLEDGDEFDKKLLGKMTGDRGEVLQGIRRFFLKSEHAIEGDDQLNLLKITNLCERFLWLLGELRLDNGEAVRLVDIDLVGNESSI